ncbi:MAG: HU family DNA-binding protein [Ardenticatenaceae bacterium]|nr:HU family DNA-binding protein [Anaerolineales bacterium]MCB8923187.1 HU family DNA-binding protein [Ardenticatenaceae bacterium]MCB9004868.1 HU family DNA-binding protein [Ardenticatenaceae bacterium]
MATINILAVISKLRPRVKYGRTYDLDDLADEIAEQSGFDKGDARDFGYKLAKVLVNHLKFGDNVKLGEIGSFSVSCNKDKKLKVVYQPSTDIKKELTDNFRGEFTNGKNAGLTMEGFAQLWLETNPTDAVIMRDGTTRTAT